MKKIIFILIFSSSIKSLSAQNELNEQKCYSFKTEYCWESPEWGKDCQANYTTHGPYTIHECLQKEMAVKTGKRMINSLAKTWDETKVVMHCTCEGSKNKSLKTTGNNNGSGNNKKSSSTPVVNNFSGGVENGKSNLLQQKNDRNEQNANKFEGGRPSSEKAYNLPELYGSSNQNNKKSTDKKVKVVEYDSDDDGIIDTKVTARPGEAPIYEKITPEKNSSLTKTDKSELPTTDNNNNNGQTQPSEEKSYMTEYGFDAPLISNIAEIAQSLGHETFGQIGEVAQKALDIEDAKKILRLFVSPEDPTAVYEATNTIGSRIASSLSMMSGLMYNHFIAPIPQLQNDIGNASLENSISILQTGNYDDKEVWRVMGNYLGNSIGMSNVGDRAKDFTIEGDKSWGNLKKEYGFIEGTKKAAYYYLLNDLKEKSKQPE